MVMMLCMATAAMAADPVVFHSLDELLDDCSGNGYTAEMFKGTLAYSYDSPASGSSGGSSLSLDGASAAKNGIDTCIFDDTPWSIVFWFKTTGVEQMIAAAASAEVGLGEDFAVGIWIDAVGAVVADLWYNSAVGTTTEGLNDGEWHHCAVVYEGNDNVTIYIDGAEDVNDDFANPYNFDCSAANSTFSFGDSFNPDHTGDLEASPYTGLLKDVGVYAAALDLAGVTEAKNNGVSCYGPANPLLVDPNTTLVYETGETMGDFDVSLKFPPLGQGPANQGTPYTITVTIDPNGGFGGWGASAEGEKDIQLLAGQGADNQITLTFDNTNWNQPQTILFKALDDTVAEPPELIEINNIGVTITSTVAEPNLNGDLEGNPWVKLVEAQVWDNDQADILFTYTPAEKDTPKYPVTGPVQIWEEPRWFFGSPYDRWRKIGITLQVPPLVDGDPCQPTSVKLQAAVEGDNPPLTDPTLPFAETDDPNGIIFTAANYNVTQSIKVWGNDDQDLQAIDAVADGDEDYQATLVVTVIDGGGDPRYQWQELEDPEDPCSPLIDVALERTVTFDIEDNECGAYGILPMDVSNSHYITDPNWAEDDPDCYVDIYDVIRMAKQWLKCTDPQGTGCAKPPEE